LYEPQFAQPARWRAAGLDPFAAFLRRAPREGSTPHPLLDDSAFRRDSGTSATDGAGLLRDVLAGRAPLPASPTGPHAAPAAVPGTPVGAVLQTARASALRWRSDQELLDVQRFTDDYDEDRERAFLQRWRDPEGLPDPADGGLHVSVVLPCWNRQEKVVDAIRSVQEQTLASWELLVVDDGSSDDSAAVVEALAAEDPRVVLLRQSHAGVCAARNLGLARARGRYVAFLDSDNEYLPDFLHVAVAAMDAGGLRAAYAMLRADDDGTLTYRTLEAGDDVLRVRNFIDLNVLVVERSLVQEVGGFDDTLRRTVDYDLVLRLRRHTEIPLLPFLAVDYHHDSDDSQRITNREAASWVEVVQSRAFVDWSGLAGREQVVGRTSLVLYVDKFQEPRAVWEAVGVLLASLGEDEDVEVVLASSGTTRAVALVCDVWACVDARVRVHHEPVDRHRALATNLSLYACTGDVVVVAPLGLSASPGWVGALRAGLDDEATVAVQPLLVQATGTVSSAGAVRPPGRGMPVRLLEDHPVEDAMVAGEALQVPALDDQLLAVRFRDLVTAGGLDPLFRNAWEVSDLSLRLAADGRRLQCRTRSVVTVPPLSHSATRFASSSVNRGLFGERWDPGTGTSPAPWRALGLRVMAWRQLPAPGIAARLTSPVLERLGRDDGTQAPEPGAPGAAAAVVVERPVRRRWAIKTGAPAGPDGRAWGDVHFAEALASALGRIGQEVVVDSRAAHDRGSSYLDEVVLSLRGLVAVNPSPGAISVCWVISHPDMLTPQEARLFDRVVAASEPWSQRTSREWGQRIDPMLQCTDAQRFVPPTDSRPGPQALFVGNSRNVFRPIVRDALEAGLDLTLYGSRWAQFVGAERVTGTYVENSLLPGLYGTCGVLLNDHWDDMRREGFMSNRLFDAAATGARVVSDRIEGLEVFDGLVRAYDDVEDLRSLVDAGIDTVFPAHEARLKVAERVRREHSFDARARQLVDLVEEVDAQRRR